jgi:hypothetical protein
MESLKELITDANIVNFNTDLSGNRKIMNETNIRPKSSMIPNRNFINMIVIGVIKKAP